MTDPKPLSAEEEARLRAGTPIPASLALSWRLVRRLLATLDAEREAAAKEVASLADALTAYAEDRAARTPAATPDALQEATDAETEHRVYRIVERAANMGGCSQTHHEHLLRDARKVLTALGPRAALASGVASVPAPTLDVERLARSLSRIRGVHNSPSPEAEPCDWCRLAAEQAAQALAALAADNRTDTP